MFTREQSLPGQFSGDNLQPRDRGLRPHRGDGLNRHPQHPAEAALPHWLLGALPPQEVDLDRGR